ncbi:MAG: polyphenol oxidase family protein [Verrucomicrobiota bacterium]
MNPEQDYFPVPFETFPALDALPHLWAVFLRRVPGLDVRTERETALSRLAKIHRNALDAIGFSSMPLATAMQIHSPHVVRVALETPFPVADCDALVTTVPGLCLGIYVADCAAVYLADRQGRGIALAHSGRNGTALGIVPHTIAALLAATGASPQDLVVQISPCIRPPHYETDFAATIRQQAADCGVPSVHDCGHCTASHPEAYYSYRLEKGRTGRHLAALALTSKPPRPSKFFQNSATS